MVWYCVVVVGHCSLNLLANMTRLIKPYAGEYGVVLCCGICCFPMGVCVWKYDDGRCSM